MILKTRNNGTPKARSTSICSSAEPISRKFRSKPTMAILELPSTILDSYETFSTNKRGDLGRAWVSVAQNFNYYETFSTNKRGNWAEHGCGSRGANHTAGSRNAT